MRPRATFSFFFLFLFFIFSLSSLLLPPCCSFLRVHPSSFPLLRPSSSFSFLRVPLPRPALSKSFRIRGRPFFIDLDKSVTYDQPANHPTDRRTDKASNRDARTHRWPLGLVFSFFHLPRPSFLLVAPSSSSLLPPRPSIFLVQHCLCH